MQETKKNKITVIITSYNLENSIAGCLDELLYQTFKDFNILIFDDLSTDNTARIISEYQKKYPEKIKLLSAGKNLGTPARARNYVLNSGAVNARYCIFLDGDDSIEPHFLEQLYLNAVKFDADVVLCSYNRVDGKTGHVYGVEMIDFPHIIEQPAQTAISAFINGSVWNKLFLSERIGETRFPNITVGEDMLFQQRIYQKCNRIVCINQVLIHYKVHKYSVMECTSEKDAKQLVDEFASMSTEAGSNQTADIVELLAFIHAGLSMTIRVNSSNKKESKQYIKSTSRYFNEAYGWFKDNKLFKLKSLRQFGKKGYAVYITKKLYSMGFINLFLLVYKMFTKFTKREIKF